MRPVRYHHRLCNGQTAEEEANLDSGHRGHGAVAAEGVNHADRAARARRVDDTGARHKGDRRRAVALGKEAETHRGLA
jgi:hypothetical protein